jgi:OOP family OmpA-OmpF porin
MRKLVPVATLILAACGGASQGDPATPEERAASGGESATVSEGPGADEGTAPAASNTPAANEFVVRTSEKTEENQDTRPSKLKPTKTEAVLKFIVVDKDKGPLKGIVVSLTAPDGKKYYTEETDETGYTEVLVPVGQTYELVYLSLGRKDVAARVPVANEPNQNVKLTLRYKRHMPPTPEPAEPRIVLEGIMFDTGKATLRPESLPRFDSVVEFMTYKKSARIEISGHTDNVGNPKANKTLSLKRAQACKDYLVSRGIDPSRIEAVGYGDERPIASNDTEEGRQQNRRIEAREL